MKSTVKKIITITLALVLAACVLAACAPRLSGTYRSSGALSQTYTFDKDTVKFTPLNLIGGEVSGTYEIKDGKITITYTAGGLSYTDSYSFSQSGNSIFINGKEFVKQ